MVPAGGRGYLDVVWTGVLGDLLGHRAVELPGDVGLAGLHTVLQHHEGKDG